MVRKITWNKRYIMKQLLLTAILALSSLAMTAQTYYKDAENTEIYRPAEAIESCRKEIILPDVNGYKVLKADLHTHSIFSDGHVSPKFRTDEAWQDGLDIMAVTEHLEYRPREDWFVEYTQKYNGGKYTKAVNHKLHPKPIKEPGIMVDLNYSYKMAQESGSKHGLIIIHGVEITRDGGKVGHFNALFTKDNNIIFDPDPVQSAKNAKAQGALIMHNHPGWKKTDLTPTPTEATLYAEGLVDGIEVVNGSEFYPGIIDRAHEYNFFVAANTDVHSTTALDYRLLGYDRPMTLVFAKEKTLESVREALEARRTLAYGFGAVSGEEQLLKDFFAAGIKVSVIRKSSKNIHLAVTNMTSITYVLTRPGENPVRLAPFYTVWYPVPLTATTLDLTVLNMFCAKDKHPVVSLTF